MKPGPKTEPPSRKRARQTFQPHRHAGLAEIAAPDDLPQAPIWLTPAGREIWLDLVTRTSRTGLACELDSALLATLANLIGACAACWKAGAAPPASHLAELRRLSELFGLAGAPSRVIAGGIKSPGPNPFSRNGRRGALADGCGG